MKKYVKPMMESEWFMPNAYCSACYDYTVQLQCAIPGTTDHTVNDGTAARKNHGLCGNLTNPMEVSGSHGYEVDDYGNVILGRPITNIVIGARATENTVFSTNIGTYTGELSDGNYMATWTSTDNVNDTGSYQHYGLAQVSSAIADPSRPNHS